MRIGLDATRVLLPTGEGIYTREVIKSMIKCFPQDEFIVVVPSTISDFEANNVNQIVYKEVDGLASRLHYAYKMGQITRKHNTDIFHNLTNYFILNASCPVITTIHDLVTLRYPSVRSSGLHAWIYKHILPLLLKTSAALVAISQATASDIQHFYGLETKTHVIPNGINHDKFYYEPTIPKDTIAHFNLPEKYILFVGYITPKKNIDVVVKALIKLRQHNFTPTLVLVGKRGYGSKYFFEQLKESVVEDQVVETGYVSNNELTALYQHASLFVFPSVHEGFGLPVVEAMACGAPVLCSNTGPIPEMVGDNGRLCCPYDIDCWSEGIREALEGSSIRKTARHNNPNRAKEFSWINTAQSLHNLYTCLIANNQECS